MTRTTRTELNRATPYHTKGGEIIMASEIVEHPSVFITPEAKDYLDAYIRHAVGEVSGLGEVTVIDGALVITGVHLLEQECGTASTEFTADAIAKFLVECVQKDIDTSTLRLWWHSHADMSVFWSGTDKDTVEQLSSDMPWLLSLVGNKAGDILVRLDLKEPFVCRINKLPVTVLRPQNEALAESIKKELAEKVAIKKYLPLVKGKYTGYHYPMQTPKAGTQQLPDFCGRYSGYDRFDDVYFDACEEADEAAQGFGNFINDDVVSLTAAMESQEGRVISIKDMTTADLETEEWDEARLERYRRNKRRKR